MRTILSIDPGLKGALAWLTEAGALIGVEDMPVVDSETSPALLYRLVREYSPDMVAIEQQQSMPKQGVASSFKTGMGYGILLGAAASLEVPMYLRRSNVWKKTLGLTSDKERSRKAALQRWPEHADLFKLKKHEGRAEAALLGLALLTENGSRQPRRRVVKVLDG